MSTSSSSNARHPDACRDWGELADEIALFGYYGGLNQKLQNSTGYWTNSGYWKEFDDDQPMHDQRPAPDADQQQKAKSVHSSGSSSSSSSSSDEEVVDASSAEGPKPQPADDRQPRRVPVPAPVPQQPQPEAQPVHMPVHVYIVDESPGKAVSKVTHYSKSGRFEAVCGFHGAKCRRERTSRGRPNLGYPGRGRCAGELIAWVRAGAHVDAAAHWWYTPPKADRRACRNEAKLTQAGRDLLARERAQGTDRDSEPDSPF